MAEGTSMSYVECKAYAQFFGERTFVWWRIICVQSGAAFAVQDIGHTASNGKQMVDVHKL